MDRLRQAVDLIGERYEGVDPGEALRILAEEPEAERWAQLRQVVECIRERNKHIDPDEVLRIVTEEVEAVRQENYEREQRQAQGGR